MGKKIIAIFIFGLCAAVYTFAFEYLGDAHQGLMVFGSLIVAIAAGRRSVNRSTSEEI